MKTVGISLPWDSRKLRKQVWDRHGTLKNGRALAVHWEMSCLAWIIEKWKTEVMGLIYSIHAAVKIREVKVDHKVIFIFFHIYFSFHHLMTFILNGDPVLSMEDSIRVWFLLWWEGIKKIWPPLWVDKLPHSCPSFILLEQKRTNTVMYLKMKTMTLYRDKKP